jgi:hypothetical protein
MTLLKTCALVMLGAVEIFVRQVFRSLILAVIFAGLFTVVTASTCAIGFDSFCY